MGRDRTKGKTLGWLFNHKILLNGYKQWPTLYISASGANCTTLIMNVGVEVSSDDYYFKDIRSMRLIDCEGSFHQRGTEEDGGLRYCCKLFWGMIQAKRDRGDFLLDVRTYLLHLRKFHPYKSVYHVGENAVLKPSGFKTQFFDYCYETDTKKINEFDIIQQHFWNTGPHKWRLKQPEQLEY